MTVKKDQRVNTDGAAEDLIKKENMFSFCVGSDKCVIFQSTHGVYLGEADEP